MIHKDYCSRCWSRDVPLMKYSKTGNNQYYYCRPCNKERMQVYGKTYGGKEAISRALRHNWDKNPVKVKARQAVAYAVKRGYITKADNCSSCGDSGRIEGHHESYDVPLDVVWLCSGCHADKHKVE